MSEGTPSRFLKKGQRKTPLIEHIRDLVIVVQEVEILIKL